MKTAIRKAMEEKGLTVAAFQSRLYAEGIDVSRQAISIWLAGGGIEFEKIPVICRVLGIEPNALFCVKQ